MNVGRFILALAALCAAYALTGDSQAPSPHRRSTRDQTFQPAALLRLVPEPAAGATALVRYAAT